MDFRYVPSDASGVYPEELAADSTARRFCAGRALAVLGSLQGSIAHLSAKQESSNFSRKSAVIVGLLSRNALGESMLES
jgi:hypothetical protein